MINEKLAELYSRIRLMHYQTLFTRIREKNGSLSATEAFSVDAIYLLRNPTIKQFSDFLGISQPNATYKVSNLIEKGYIVKVPSEEDRREWRLCVSDKFLGYMGSTPQFIENAAKMLEDNFSEEECAVFDRMLSALTNAIERG